MDGSRHDDYVAGYRVALDRLLDGLAPEPELRLAAAKLARAPSRVYFFAAS